jgi:hypothetical protein
MQPNEEAPRHADDGRRWQLWYNGRRGVVEQIGLALHDGEDLGFGRPLTPNAR